MQISTLKFSFLPILSSQENPFRLCMFPAVTDAWCTKDMQQIHVSYITCMAQHMLQLMVSEKYVSLQAVKYKAEHNIKQTGRISGKEKENLKQRREKIIDKINDRDLTEQLTTP